MSIPITIVENDTNSFRLSLEAEMEKKIKHLDGELIKVRTGRAHSSLVENIPVAAYGQPPAPLRNYATVSAPEARLLVIQPWDATTIGDIEKGISTSDLGVTPTNDGKIIRIELPQMSSSRRDDLVKLLNTKLEECRTALRLVRQDFNTALRDAKKNKTISEDFFSRLTDLLQEVTEKFTKKAEEKAERKRIDLTTI
jgi:ribosome recycling factor